MNINTILFIARSLDENIVDLNGKVNWLAGGRF